MRRQVPGRAVGWMAISFLALQAAFVAALDASGPGFYDPEAGARLALLRQRVSEKPESPVLLVVGSSRIGLGFLPGQMAPLTTPDGREAIPFNHSHLAAGPRMNLMQFHRVLRAGIQPRWVVLEILPGGMVHEGNQAALATAADLPVLMRHSPPDRTALYYLRNRLHPFYKHRRGVLESVSPGLATRGAATNAVRLERLGDDLTWMRKERGDEATRARGAALVRSIYSQRLRELPIDPALDAATRELLAVCRERGITAVLLVAPENGEYRSWYGPAGERRLAEYLAGLSREYGAGVVDARAWVPDDHFYDPHHLTLPGARIFTARLEREALRPLVAGRVPGRAEPGGP